MGKNMSFVPFLQSTAGAAPSASGSASLITFLPIILIFVIFYFFMIRPQNKKQKETERMINALKNGAFNLNKETPGWDAVDRAVNPYFYQITTGDNTFESVKDTIVADAAKAFKDFNDELKAKIAEIQG